MKIQIHHMVDGSPNLTIELVDGTRLSLSEGAQGDLLVIRKTGGPDADFGDQLFIQPKASNLIEVG